MNEHLVITYSEAKQLEFQLFQCSVCGVGYDRNNAIYFRNPICSSPDCKKVWNYIGPDLRAHCKQYFDALNRRLEVGSLLEYIEHGPILFKNNSIRNSGSSVYISTIKVQGFDSLLVSKDEYQEWFNLVSHNGNDDSYVYEATDWFPAEKLSVCYIWDYYPPLKIIDRIRELANEYTLRKSLERRIESLERNLIGYCKPTKYKIKRTIYETRKLQVITPRNHVRPINVFS